MIPQKFVPLKIMKGKEKKEILEKLDAQFGISSVNGEIFARGREKLFLFTGKIKENELKRIEEVTVVERVGIYFAKIDENTDDLRLSIEGSQILGDQITKNILELTSYDDVENWMKGHELNIRTGKKGFVIIKFKDEFLGTGKASEEKVANFIPKNRRLKEKS